MAVKKPTATKSISKSGKVSSPKGRLGKSAKAETEEAAGDREVTIDRRRSSRRQESDINPAPAKLERRTKVQRRRQIDPTTCERDYTEEEVAFMNAMDEYKRTSGRMFPTCSEVLEVIRGLGYVKLSPAEIAVIRPASDSCDSPVAVTADEEAECEVVDSI